VSSRAASQEAMEIASLVYELIMRDDPQRLLELNYYAQEPGVLELIRAIMALEAPTREAIGSLLSGADDCPATDDDDESVTISRRKRKRRGRTDIN
jgi:hypothetical protein